MNNDSEQPANKIQTINQPHTQQAQIVPDAIQVVTTSPQPPKPNRMSYIIVALVLLFAMSFAIYLTTSKGFVNCLLFGKRQVSNRIPGLQEELASISFTPHPTAQQTKTDFRGGDCVDSAPHIHIIKTISTSDHAGVVFSQINSSLAEKGYRQSKSMKAAKKLEPCSYKNMEYYYAKDDYSLRVYLDCAQYVGEGQSWDEIPITTIRAELNADYYPY